MAIERQDQLRSVLSRLGPIVLDQKSWLRRIWLIALASAATGFVSVVLLKELTDAALSQQEKRFWTLVLIGLGAMLAEMGLKYAHRITSTRYQSQTIQGLRDRVTAHIQRLPISTTDNLHSGDLVSRLNNDIEKISLPLQRVQEVVGQPITFLFGFIYLFLLSWKLLAATCILIPLSAVLLNTVVKPMQAHARKEMEHLARANALTQDAIGGITIIKAFNLQERLREKFSGIAEQVRQEGLAIDRRAGASFAVYLLLRYTPQLVVPLYGGFLAYRGEIGLGDLLACLSLIWMVILPVESFLDWIRQLREVGPAVERVTEILDLPVEDTAPGLFQEMPGSPALAFESVCFQYDPDQPLLQDFSYRLEQGKVTALVGPSGCGKSTVLKIVCGFYRPQKGVVRLLGSDIFQTNLQDARRHVSLVAQEIYLFPASIAENIAYGRPGAARAEVIAAARAANAHEFILRQPGGYDAQAGEWGLRLSGGERQRIALARAILKDAPILLLDEPTSALDAQSEALLQEALERFMQGRTVLVVAHRLTTVQNADEIIVLNDGRVAERGTHAQLLSADTLYQRLYLRQASQEAANV